MFDHSVLILDEGRNGIDSGSVGWLPGSVAGIYGSTLGLETIDVTVAIANLIPARVIVLGVSVRVGTTITGPAAFEVGLSGDLAKFGESIGLSGGQKMSEL